MKIVVLFDGGGLSRLGLEQADHECIGTELLGNGVPVYMTKAFGESY